MLPKVPQGALINPAHPLARGLAGCWRFGEHGGLACFDSARTNKGTAAGGFTRKMTDRGRGVALDGTTGTKIDCGSSTLLRPTAAGSFVCRVKFNSVATSFTTIMSNGSMGGSEANGVNIYPQSSLLKASFNNGTASHQIVTGGTTLANGVWYQVVVTWDSSNINVWLNGKRDVTTTAQTVVPSPAFNFFIGSDGAATAGSYVNATYDYVMVYGRALTPAEVLALYADPDCYLIPPRVAVLSAALPQTVNLGFVASGEQIWAPTVVLNVAPGFVASGEQLWDLAVAQNVTLGTVASGDQVFGVTVATGVALGFVASGEQVFGPTVTQTVALSSIDSGEQVFAPAVGVVGALTVTLSFIASGESVFPLSIDGLYRFRWGRYLRDERRNTLERGRSRRLARLCGL